MALTKVSGGILDPGINVAGIVTATGFDGPFTGGSTKNITAGIITATGFDLNGNGDISGNLVIGGNLTANGDFTTLNTTLREVEILRVDANTTAVAGIITQRGSGDIFSVYDTSTEVFKIADGGAVTATGNFTISNTEPYILLQDTNNNDDFLIRNTNGVFTIRDSTNGTDRLTIDSNGLATIGKITTPDFTGTGDFTISSTLPQILLQDTDNNDDFSIRNTNGVFTIRDATNGVDRFTIDSSGNLSATAITTFLGNGSSTPIGIQATLRVANNGSSSQYSAFEAASSQGSIRLGNDGTFHVNGVLDVNSISDFADDVTFNTTNGNNILIDKSDNSLKFGNSTYAKFGGAGELMIYHDGTYSVIKDNNSSPFNFEASGTITFAKAGLSETYAKMIPDGAVELYHGMGGSTGSSKKFETTTLGAKISGNLELSSTYPSLVWTDTNHDSDFRITNDDGKLIVYDITRGAHVMDFLANGDVRIRNDKSLIIGEGSDLKIFHDNSATNNVIEGHTGSLNLRNYNVNSTDIVLSARRNILLQTNLNEIGLQCLANGATELFYDGGTYTTPKLRTSTTGIEVTGEVAASQDYPDFRPTLDLNFAAEKKLDPRITYQRTGVASFVNEFGKLIIVGDNVPRFDHDPTTRECKGLLIEESRTNQWLYSEDLVTYVANSEMQQSTLANTTATTDPTGGTNAVKMAATATGGAHSFYKMFTSGSNGDVHTASVWVKAAGVDYARIYVDTVGGNMGGPGVTFSTGNTWNVTASGTATQAATSVVKYPNGWWRLSVSGSFSSQNAYYVHIDLEGGEGDVSFTGNGSDGMYVWGVQFESGIFPTSYMPTSGRSVTRGEDVVRIMDDDFTDIFGTQFENFSVVADFDNSNSFDGNNASILEWWSDNNNYYDRIQIFKDNSSPYHIETRAFGNNAAIFSNGNLSASSKAASNKFATSWSVDYSTNNAANRRWAFSFSGEAVDVVGDNTGTTVPALTRFGIGCSPYKLDITRGVLLFKRLMVYNQTLSDNQLRTLSS